MKLGLVAPIMQTLVGVPPMGGRVLLPPFTQLIFFLATMVIQTAVGDHVTGPQSLVINHSMRVELTFFLGMGLLDF